MNLCDYVLESSFLLIPYLKTRTEKAHDSFMFSEPGEAWRGTRSENSTVSEDLSECLPFTWGNNSCP